MPFAVLLFALAAALLPSSDFAHAAKAYESVSLRATAMPLINFNSDDGTGYGMRVNFFRYDGQSRPYARLYSVQGFATTGGKWVHRVRMDTPNFRPGERLEVEAVYEKEEFANYYGGLGDQEIAAYSKDRKTFQQTYPTLVLKWVRDLRVPWRLRVGLQLGHNSIEPNAAEGSILRILDPLGADGGTLLQFNSSLRYDTRDDYTNSTRGVFEELLVEYGFGAGGDFNGVRLSYQHRQFLALHQSLVLAYRTNGDITFGDVPFYEGLELGGSSTVRGLAAARERGEGRLLCNGELRWAGVPVWPRRHMYLGLLLFADAGQIFARADGPDLGDWRTGRGGGLRFHWYSTIVRADYGAAGDRTAIYITFSQVF